MSADPKQELRVWFPEISEEQWERLDAFCAYFREWNERMNLVSRKDIDQFERHHLAHALALTKFYKFRDRCRVLDVGSGGGLPGLPLAICFPRVQFYLCDSIQKKMKAVADMIERLGLKNAEAVCKRAETLESKWDYVTGRAVTALPRFIGWTRKNIRGGGPEDFPHGILYWKGSLYKEELESLKLEPHRVMDIHDEIADSYFEEKYIIHLNTHALQRLPSSAVEPIG
ncbi:MAG: 16S rRNA (guanine(527)-N(7))-methyltransferase RsmG [Opitutales bacterium]|nr:16S rRNA (guanine(527)-N(7))-methyltransferase RsmG [Opitutales bacterium]